MLLELAADLPYTPGDHVGVFACNRQELVDGVLSRLQTTTDPDQPVELQMQKENHTSNGKLHVMRTTSSVIVKYSRCRIMMLMR
jgi:sulfite reductase alpha subunit-like flavoprotein